MTRDEAVALVQDLHRLHCVPPKYKYGDSNTLAVHGGWVRLGEEGIRSAYVSREPKKRQRGGPLDWDYFVTVYVDGMWYDVGRQEEE